jgi:hypothetical protein
MMKAYFSEENSQSMSQNLDLSTFSALTYRLFSVYKPQMLGVPTTPRINGDGGL